LDGRPEVEVLETLAGPTGDLRVESRTLGSSRRELKVLVEGGRLRGAEDMEGNPARSWEEAVLEGTKGREEGSLSVLILGGGSGTLARLLSERDLVSTLRIVERSRALVMLARSHFMEWEGWEAVDLRIGEPFARHGVAGQPFSLVVVDCGTLPTLGEAPLIGEPAWAFLNEAVAEDGALVLGGLRLPADGIGEPVAGLMDAGRSWFSNASLFRGAAVPKEERLLEEKGDEKDAFLLFARGEAAPWSGPLARFRRMTTPAE
jgi:hypothetical protein